MIKFFFFGFNSHGDESCEPGPGCAPRLILPPPQASAALRAKAARLDLQN
jgi:hypothetical protein